MLDALGGSKPRDEISPKTDGPRESVILVILGYVGPFFGSENPRKRWWEMKPGGKIKLGWCWVFVGCFFVCFFFRNIKQKWLEPEKTYRFSCDPKEKLDKTKMQILNDLIF